jgi:hypothetical protein
MQIPLGLLGPVAAIVTRLAPVYVIAFCQKCKMQKDTRHRRDRRDRALVARGTNVDKDDMVAGLD